MNENDIVKHMDLQGVPYMRVQREGKETLRVMDVTQLPQIYREHFDEHGYFTPKDESSSKGGKK